MTQCSFKPGDRVTYSPTKRGYGLENGARLEVGKVYKIENITDDCYITVEGYHHPGGGIYWTEFTKVSCNSERE